MSIDAIGDSKEQFDDRDSQNIAPYLQADLDTWLFLGLLIAQTSIDFPSFSLPKDAEANAALKHFMLNIHDLPQLIKTLRATINSQEQEWVARKGLSPEYPLLEKNFHSCGAYLELDAAGSPIAVIKPSNEGLGGLHNPKGMGLLNIPPRRDIPLYQSVQRECASYEISKLLGFDIVPETRMALVYSGQFHDILDAIRNGEYDRLFFHCKLQEKAAALVSASGAPSPYKLCSYRSYVPSASTLHFFTEILGDDSLNTVDPKDIEKANILAWIIGHSDGHLANFLTYPKETGGYGLKLIDLDQTFPEQNQRLLNMLPDVFSTSTYLSEEGRNLIANFPKQDVIAILQSYGLEASTAAFCDRLEVLQQLAHLSTQEIDSRLKALHHLGKERVVDTTQSIDQPRHLLSNTSSSTSSWFFTTSTDTSFSQLQWLRG